jgi:hypothetical protein
MSLSLQVPCLKIAHTINNPIKKIFTNKNALIKDRVLTNNRILTNNNLPIGNKLPTNKILPISKILINSILPQDSKTLRISIQRSTEEQLQKNLLMKIHLILFCNTI